MLEGDAPYGASPLCIVLMPRAVAVVGSDEAVMATDTCKCYHTWC